MEQRTDRAGPRSADRADAASAPEAIFVVGVSRSGTTLMRRVLGSHSQVAIATESHYLGHLLVRQGARHRFRRLGDLRDDATIRRLVADLHDGTFEGASRLREASPFWRWLRTHVPRETLEARLLESDRTEADTFRVVLRLYADARGRAIMGEKSPAHLAWASTLLEWFPRGHVVHMIRDPRAVFASEVRRRAEVPGGVPYHQLQHVPPLMRAFLLHQVAWSWAGAVGHHRHLSRVGGGRYHVVSFEDLVTTPRATLQALLDALGLPMEERCLRQRVVSRGFTARAQGFDAMAATRWRVHVSPLARRWLSTLLGGRMAEMGYPARPDGDDR